MKLICLGLIFIIASLLSGCATITVETADCRATYTTVWKDLEAANFSVCGGMAEVLESDTNDALFRALLQAATK